MKNLLITSSVWLLFAAYSCKDSSDQNKEKNTPNDSIAVSRRDQPATEKAAPDSAAMMKAWAEYMTPGPMHKWMASADGKWEAEVRSCTEPGGPLGAPSKASVENKMIMNGLYQETVYKGNMMGMPFEGKGLMAYDNG